LKKKSRPKEARVPTQKSSPMKARVPAELPAQTKVSDLPIVGIGASAGGLDAFEIFFRNIPAASGMAFILVSHLAPDHPSLLTEILQRSSKIPVIEAADQMKVAADHVYVIPPNRDIALLHGLIQLSMPVEPRGIRTPIEIRSCALSRTSMEREPSV
jgi:two-component system, chemotaxis family, CheB/CheR fusion protein